MPEKKSVFVVFLQSQFILFNRSFIIKVPRAMRKNPQMLSGTATVAVGSQTAEITMKVYLCYV